MKFSTLSAIAAATVLATISAPAQAAILSVSGAGEHLTGNDIPGDVGATGASSTNILGFNEQQGVTLIEDLEIDGGFIPSGTVVNSHLIFLNQPVGATGDSHRVATWTFEGTVLGVLSDIHAELESASNPVLGLPDVIYPGAENNRGLEDIDSYEILGSNRLFTSFRVARPGDWIRVITEAPTQSVPEPASILGLLGISAGLLMKKKG